MIISKIKDRKGGFTLVELIVVLVILALLAAILVPTLTGYINKAKDEKNMATAETVRVAAQVVIDEQLANGNVMDGAIDSDEANLEVLDLAGISSDDVTYFTFTYGDEAVSYAIDEGIVTIGDGTYLYSEGAWSVDKGVSSGASN